MKKLITLILAVGWGMALMAQDSLIAVRPHYNYYIDSTNISLGDQFTLTVHQGESYPTPDELTNNEMVAVRQWYDTVSGNQYTAMTCFTPGQHWFHIGDDSLLISVSDVADVDTATLEIKDIDGIMRQPYTFWEIFRWVLLGLGIAALGFGGWYVYKRIKSRQPIIPIPATPPLPADQKALNNLEALRQKQLWQQGKLKEYHTELTDILRLFLEEQYNIPSAEMTSDQTLDAFSDCKAFTAERENMLRQTFQTADMVKFAKSEPLPYQHDLSMNNAVSFIQGIQSEIKATELKAQEMSNSNTTQQ